MSLRLGAIAFLITTAAAVAACQSSAPYGTPAHAAIGTGIAVAGAAASRAAGGCFAQCLPGTMCNPANGLCERTEPHPTPVPAVATAKPTARKPPAATASYPPGHEYNVPPASAADAGCDPPANSEGGAISCEMDGGVPH